MPLILAHEAFTKHAILKSADKVSIALIATSTASTPPLIDTRIHVAIRWRGIVGRAWL